MYVITSYSIHYTKLYERILAGQYHDQFVVDMIQGGAGTSTNMNANEVIANVGLELLDKARNNFV